MKYIKVPNTDMSASEISLGCMRISEMTNQEISTLIHTAMDEGINFFDHADVYGGGQCEEKFSEALEMNSRLREKVMLHRPDALVEPEDVAEAFTILETSGKVKYFGVSNQNPMQIELLCKFVTQKIHFNQLQLSITNTGMIDAGINVNMQIDRSINRDGSILDYCRLKDIIIQPWSPFQYGFFEGVFLDNAKFPELNQKINAIAADKGVTNTAIAIAWLLRHPAHMQPILGTTNPQRVKDSCQASGITLSREEWYQIYLAAGNQLP